MVLDGVRTRVGGRVKKGPVRTRLSPIPTTNWRLEIFLGPISSPLKVHHLEALGRCSSP